jgi:hypothetical protein
VSRKSLWIGSVVVVVLIGLPIFACNAYFRHQEQFAVDAKAQIRRALSGEDQSETAQNLRSKLRSEIGEFKVTELTHYTSPSPDCAYIHCKASADGQMYYFEYFFKRGKPQFWGVSKIEE